MRNDWAVMSKRGAVVSVGGSPFSERRHAMQYAIKLFKEWLEGMVIVAILAVMIGGMATVGFVIAHFIVKYW